MPTIENISPNTQQLSDGSKLSPGATKDVIIGAAETALINRGYLRVLSGGSLVLGASPAVVVAEVEGLVSVVAGSVSLIEFTLDNGQTWNVFARQTGEDVPVRPGDQVRITYSVVPTVNLIVRED